MTDLLVRNIDPFIVERLKEKAKRNGRSLQQEAKEILERAAPVTPEELDKMFRTIDATFVDGPITVSIEDLMREEREARGG